MLDRGHHHGEQRDRGEPRLDRGMLNVSGWWLLLWLVVAIAALWLLEQVGAFA